MDPSSLKSRNNMIDRILLKGLNQNNLNTTSVVVDQSSPISKHTENEL